ncbi:uncharacterized protein LOC132304990 [Cornus florida]|uniref:uncharacterized protein LOC132304990 n=1 Tax=Cornus florida TaxID=4283 RepID=UPI0028A0756A|nr:uncharacterized protein LOC132304990 [Cornus florida]
MALPLPTKFKMPQLDSFDGTRDPLDHLETFKSFMNLQAIMDEIMCRAFPTTLKGSAWVWFNKLKPGSINDFDELIKQFIRHFITGMRHRNPATYLLNVKQDKGESLHDYIGRFNTEMLQVDDVDDKVTLTAFMGGLQSSKFLFSLSKDPPNSMVELLIKAQKYMNTEDAMNSRKGKRVHDKKGDKKSQILLQIQDDHSLKWPLKLKLDPTRRSRDKYCRFYRDHGHNTDDCFDLKNKIESLIRRGQLHRYVTEREKGATQPTRENRKNNPPGRPLGEIKVIMGGFACGGELSLARKAHIRRVRSSARVNEVKIHEPPPKSPRVEGQDITF